MSYVSPGPLDFIDKNINKKVILLIKHIPFVGQDL